MTTIYIPGESGADVSSYTGLVSAVASWLERDDLADKIPLFIQMAEARFRRLLTSPEGEVTLTLTPGASVSLPADFDSARSLYLASNPRQVITQVNPDFFNAEQSAGAVASAPTIYTIVGKALLFNPAPSADLPVVLTYRQNIPALSAAQTNWLFDRHPDLYLYASLIHAEFYGWNDERLTLIKSAVDEMIAEVQLATNRKRYGGSPLQMRPPSTDAIGRR